MEDVVALAEAMKNKVRTHLTNMVYTLKTREIKELKTKMD